MKFFLYLILSVCLAYSCGSEASKTTDAKNTSNSISEKKSEKATEAAQTKKRILFFGNSLTVGYGLAPEQAFPNLIQLKIDSLGLSYNCINAGLSGETTAGGLQRLDWLLREKVDVFVLELGANDGLRGLPVTESKKNLEAIIEKVKLKYPDVKIILAGMQVPPNMGEVYSSDFKMMYYELAEEHDIQLLEFLLDGVAGDSKLNLADGIHPNPRGHQIVAQNVWESLIEVLDLNKNNEVN